MEGQASFRLSLNFVDRLDEVVDKIGGLRHVHVEKDPQGAVPDAVALCDLLQAGGQLILLHQQVGGGLLKSQPRGRQSDRPSGADKQLDAVMLLQPLNLLAEGGLGDVQVVGGPAEAQTAGHGEKILQQAEVHGSVLSLAPGFDAEERGGNKRGLCGSSRAASGWIHPLIAALRSCSKSGKV